MSYDSTGAGARPTLGRGKPVGLAKPGKGQKLTAAYDGDIPKVARPGGNGGRERVSSGGTIPKVARPGKAGSSGQGAGTAKSTPDW
jgi:hypothetical protein